MAKITSTWSVAAGLAMLVGRVAGEDILQTVGFTNCGSNSTIEVSAVDIQYKSEAKEISFDIRGVSGSTQNVTAILQVTAYGNDIFSQEFDPCDSNTFVEQFCPVPEGAFTANGTLPIPDDVADLVPDIVYQFPDIEASAGLQLVSQDTAQTVACVESQVTNGKTASVPAVSYISASVAGVALVMSGVGAAGAAMAGGSGAMIGTGSAAGGAAGTVHPSFGDFLGAMQGIAMTGMVSVPYPPIVRSFTKNFAFSTGLVSWNDLQISIDSFRSTTGGDLTRDSFPLLQNTTLVFEDGSTVSTTAAKVKRAVDMFVHLARRQIDLTDEEQEAAETIKKTVSGIQAFSEQLLVPESNTFLTILLIVSIVIGVIIVGILLVKVVLEIWALFASFPKNLMSLRNDYWGVTARAITHVILLLYGIWVLYSIFQFTNGDSWAAKALAAATLGMFTLILGMFSYKIYSTAKKLKSEEGDAAGLYDRKDIWTKYSMFYDSYSKNYWWLFIPNTIYLFARGVILAVFNGQGFTQAIALLIVESIMLFTVAFTRPFERRSGNIINIAILVVRILSVACLLVFVEELGMDETTKSVSGVALIAVQSTLTGILAVLIVWNACIAMCKKNPHRKRRKEMGKSSEKHPSRTRLTNDRKTQARAGQPHATRRPPLPLRPSRLQGLHILPRKAAHDCLPGAHGHARAIHLAPTLHRRKCQAPRPRRGVSRTSKLAGNGGHGLKCQQQEYGYGGSGL